MLRKLRVWCATTLFILITLLFLDFTGVIHLWFGWLAKIQLLPAILAMNFVVVALLLLLTLLFGRLYCSVICPLGIMQDIFSHFGAKRKKFRFSYHKEHRWLRYIMLTLFVVSLAAGGVALISIFAKLIAPYSAYGRIAQNLFAPIYTLCNNILAFAAERIDSYAIYSSELWIRNWAVFGVSLATLIILGVVAWRSGRLYCNTICPVGTALGLLSRFSLLKPVIDTEKCNGCGLCAKGCKSSCIDSKNHAIDYSRCVVCFDCIENCTKGAISYSPRRKSENREHSSTPEKSSRRRFLLGVALLGASVAKAQRHKSVDGGLAAISHQKLPKRNTPILPPGARSLRNFVSHCTGCQLCVEACQNHVLRPSSDLTRFMQPESSFERGYCRPECTRCSEVCPTGAIKLITPAEKSAIQVGGAVWISENCLVTKEGVKCDNCAHHCPTGAITMVAINPEEENSAKRPVINPELCIGCGACENLCPQRPFSAIYVEGYEHHRSI